MVHTHTLRRVRGILSELVTGRRVVEVYTHAYAGLSLSACASVRVVAFVCTVSSMSNNN